jgi:hypothetical protein
MLSILCLPDFPMELQMKSYVRASLLSLAILATSNPVWSGNTVQCPELSQARQILECPGEEEIERMFKATCGFERDPNAKEPELCDTRTEFKRRKNTALWESADGEFSGYITCDTPAAQIKKLSATGIAVSQKNGLYKVDCGYRDGIKLTLRTRSVCKVPGVKNSGVVMRAKCGPDASTCKAECQPY